MTTAPFLKSRQVVGARSDKCCPGAKSMPLEELVEICAIFSVMLVRTKAESFPFMALSHAHRDILILLGDGFWLRKWAATHTHKGQ